MGGGSKYRLIQVLSGVDIMKVYVEMVMGQKPKVEPRKQYNNAIMSYVYCYPGIYESIVGLEELKEKGIILDYFIYRGSNSAIEKSNTSSDRVAGFLVVGASKDEVENKLEEANATLCVLNDKGELQYGDDEKLIFDETAILLKKNQYRNKAADIPFLSLLLYYSFDIFKPVLLGTL